MFPPEAFQPLLVSMAGLLETHGVRFAVTGGLVSAFYSEPRYTQDADVVVDADQLTPVVDVLVHDFQQAGYLAEVETIRDAIRRGRQFQLFHTEELLKIDMYPRELVSGELDRAVKAELFPGVMLPIIAKTDLAVCKLIWISKGSHKNRRDLRWMIRRFSSEEVDHVRQLADGKDLLPLLDEVLVEPDEIDLND